MRDGDGDELDALLHSTSADSGRLEESDVERVAERFFGCADSLELLREVAREERLLHALRAEITGDSEQGSSSRWRDQPSVLPIAAIIRGSDNPGARASRRMVGLAAAAALAIGVGLNWNAVSMLMRTMRAGGAAASQTAATRAAQLDTVDLPDGSRAILAPNSTLRYAIAPLRGRRELQLEGEAYFDVRHDDDRPFRVQTRHAVVEDLGTTFVVREYAGDERARVTVRSGAAALRARDGSQASPTSLRRGEGAYVDSSGAIARFSGDPESYGSWTDGRLTFDAAPLPEVLSRLARWYDVEFRTSDSTLQRQYFTGGLNSASLSKALDILGPVVHARFEQRGSVVVATPRSEGR